MDILRKQAIINAIAIGNDVSMEGMVDVSMVDDDLSFMSDDAEENASMMETSCCSKLADASMLSIDKTDIFMFEEDISFMEDEADVNIVDPNYSMHSQPEAECSYMDVDCSIN